METPGVIPRQRIGEVGNIQVEQVIHSTTFEDGLAEQAIFIDELLQENGERLQGVAFPCGKGFSVRPYCIGKFSCCSYRMQPMLTLARQNVTTHTVSLRTGEGRAR